MKICSFIEFINEATSTEAMVGDIFYSSWGYDQTNIDYYQVVKTTGKGCVVRKLKKEIVGHEGGGNIVKPIPNDFKGDDIQTKYKAYGNTVALASGKIHGYLQIWDKRPRTETSTH
jgi:hypothetical protein